jgi:phosphoribosylglycinamide formyltransferase 1
LSTATQRRPIVILISGRGSNMRSLIDFSLRSDVDAAYTVAQVISDQPGAAGLVSARESGVAAVVLPCPKGTSREDYGAMLSAEIDKHQPALVALAGFMRILSPAFVHHYSGRLLNIHPSLLPKYTGLHTHRRALDARDAEHGATVHFVTEDLDEGPRIIQARVPVLGNDSEDSLSARVIAQEHRIYPLAVQWFCQGRLRGDHQRAWLDDKPLHEPVQFSAAQLL